MSHDLPVHRLLLRAEMSHRGRSIVAHTLRIAESLVFVHTEAEAFIGDQVMLSLSFPGLIAPFSIETQVIAKHIGGAPGRHRGWVLGFVFYRAEEQTRLRCLLHGPTQIAGELSRPLVEALDRPYRIILLDDNDLTRQAFSFAARKLFGNASDTVLLDIVCDSRNAWNRIHQHSRERPYDLAIVDYFLSKSTGDRLIAEIKDDPDTSDLPIFAVSMGGAEAHDATMAAGADLFVAKPMVVRHLFHTLHQLTRREYPTTSQHRSTG